MKKIAIIGGGIAGSSVALYLSQLGLNVSLFEKKETLVDGPPICHLHAGGNLYREISDEQCLQLLRESIELVQLYPCAVDFRPTVIAVPTTDKGNPKDLHSRLEKLKKEYELLINRDIKNRVLGGVDDYYRFFNRDEVEALQAKETLEKPLTFEEWMIPVAKNIDLERVKFPLIIVQEYGLNIFRLAASVTLSLESISNAEVLTNSLVTKITEDDERYLLEYQQSGVLKREKFDYLINAAGFKSGEIDDMLAIKRDRFVEFKAAYVTKWQSEVTWPEVIFYGERGTPNGMAQFTPYPDGYVQLHGMTEDITLFKDGLVRSHKLSSQPQLNQKYVNKIYKGWKKADIDKRSSLAIEHISQFIPAFKKANVASKPLFGAQQIPGGDATLRAADVSFEGDKYARCEIVKASSVLAMADAITKRLIELGFLEKELYGRRDFETSRVFTEEKVTKFAQELCLQRDYPKSLASRNNSSLII
ncbi:MAG: FAD-dependent oxidoreductase [Campylobacterota bacterium]|nr:FAD-dependent oxidoreductase [Campylobacterota bacterium]